MSLKLKIENILGFRSCHPKGVSNYLELYEEKFHNFFFFFHPMEKSQILIEGAKQNIWWVDPVYSMDRNSVSFWSSENS